MTPYTPLELMALECKLKSMFNYKQDDFFSICDVDKMVAITHCVINSRDYNSLKLLHCIKYFAKRLKSLPMTR